MNYFTNITQAYVQTPKDEFFAGVCIFILLSLTFMFFEGVYVALRRWIIRKREEGGSISGF